MVRVVLMGRLGSAVWQIGTMAVWSELG
jgi:hypothetical protein